MKSIFKGLAAIMLAATLSHPVCGSPVSDDVSIEMAKDKMTAVWNFLPDLNVNVVEAHVGLRTPNGVMVCGLTLLTTKERPIPRSDRFFVIIDNGSAGPAISILAAEFFELTAKEYPKAKTDVYTVAQAKKWMIKVCGD